MRWLVALLFAAGLALGQAEPPRVFWVSQPVRSGQTVLVQGAGLAGLPLATVARLTDSEPGQPPAVPLAAGEQTWWPSSARALGDAAAAVPLPRMAEGLWALRWRLRGTWSTPVLINAPELWFVQGDQGDTASPGGWLGVFGTCLRLDERSPMLALAADGQPPRLVRAAAPEIGRGTAYGCYFRLPADLAPGRYALYVHNGHGGPAGWTRFQGWDHGPLDTVTIAAPTAWPTTEFAYDAAAGAS